MKWILPFVVFVVACSTGTGDRCPGGPDECAAATRCEGNTLVTCELDEDGCPVEVRTNCIQGDTDFCKALAGSASCESCASYVTAPCDTPGASCEVDVLVACAADKNGCLVETRTDCRAGDTNYCAARQNPAACVQLACPPSYVVDFDSDSCVSAAVLPLQTGQTACADESGEPLDCPPDTGTGQDGEIRFGVAWPEPRFAVTGDTVVDNLTGLEWLKDANCMNEHYPGFDDEQGQDGAVSWQRALAFVRGINDGSYHACGAGHRDWRLPNFTELRSLVAHGVDWPALPVGHPFENFSGYWSCWSSTSISGGRDALAIDFRYGVPRPGSKTFWTRGVLPVRRAGFDRVWATGQRLCYDAMNDETDCAGTGQDGEYRMGAAWPAPRFVDNGDGTLTDALTGLMWLQDANCMATHYSDVDQDADACDGAVSWQHALDFVAGVNQGQYPLCAADHDDWRLPNANEMLSLMLWADAELLSALAEAGFVNLGQAGYRISTNGADEGQAAQRAFVFDPDLRVYVLEPKNRSHHLMMVRTVGPND